MIHPLPKGRGFLTKFNDKKPELRRSYYFMHAFCKILDVGGLGKFTERIECGQETGEKCLARDIVKLVRYYSHFHRKKEYNENILRKLENFIKKEAEKGIFL